MILNKSIYYVSVNPSVMTSKSARPSLTKFTKCDIPACCCSRCCMGRENVLKRHHDITAKTRQVGMFLKEKRSRFTVCESLNITFTANNLPAS